MLRKKMMVVMAMATVMSAVVIGCGSNNSVETSSMVVNTPAVAYELDTSETTNVVSHGAEVVAEIAKVMISTEVNEVLAQEAEVTNEVAATAEVETTAPAEVTTSANTANTSSAPATTAKADTNQGTSKTATTTNHTHNFQPIYRTVHHDAVTEDQGHYENVMVQDAKYENRTTHVYGKACSCGATFYGSSESEVSSALESHSAANWDNEACGRSKNCGYDETTSVKVSDPIYENQWVSNVVTIQAAYDEQVLDHNECSCGVRQ